MKRNYKRDYEFQKKLNERQAEQIKSLKAQIDGLTSLCEEKDKLIYAVDSLREELTKKIEEINIKENEYNSLVNELKDMKKVMNQEFFKGRWQLIKLLIK